MDAKKQQWLNHAIEAGLRGNLSPEAVTEAYQVVYSAFGDSWLQEQEGKADCHAYGFMAGHHLMRNLRMGQDNSTSEVVELAQYLKEFATESSMPEVLSRLRDADSYDDCLFELAIAYRFRRIGASVKHSPQTDKGFADLAVSINGHTWICECTRQHLAASEVRRTSWRDNLMHQVSRKMSDAKIPATVKLTLQRNCPPPAFERAPQIVAELLMKLKERKWECFTHEDEELFVIVKEFSDAEDPNPALKGEWDGTYNDVANHPWEAVMDQTVMQKKHIDDIRDGKPMSDIPREKTGRLFIQTYSSERPIEPAILKKIEKKLSQTWSSEHPHPRLIFIETLGLLEELNWKTLSEGIAKQFDRKERFAGVVLMNRRYVGEQNRHGYVLYLISNNKGGYSFPSPVFARLRALERDFRIY